MTVPCKVGCTLHMTLKQSLRSIPAAREHHEIIAARFLRVTLRVSPTTQGHNNQDSLIDRVEYKHRKPLGS
jgi:hypothetical protein